MSFARRLIERIVSEFLAEVVLNNDELAASREELQTLNDELSMLNQQLEQKVQQLQFVANDLNNLIMSTRIATLFLDVDSRIRLFTPAATEIFRLQANDLGRPLQEINHRVHDETLLADTSKVLADLEPRERELVADQGRTFIRTISPYRSEQQRVEGVVITYTDVSRMRLLALNLQRRERQQGAVAELGQHALLEENVQPLMDRAVELLQSVLSVEFAKVLVFNASRDALLLQAGVGWNPGLVGSAFIDTGLNSQAGFTLQSKRPVIVEDLAEETRFTGPDLLIDHGVVSGMSVVIEGSSGPIGVLGTHSTHAIQFTEDDVNFLQSVANVLSGAFERRKVESALIESEARLRALADNIPQLAWMAQKDGWIFWYNQRWYDFTGTTLNQMQGWGWRDVHHPDHVDSVVAKFQVHLESGEPWEDTFPLRSKAGEYRWFLSRAFPVRNQEGEIVNWFGTNTDVTERQHWERELADREAHLRRVIDHMNVYVAVLDKRGALLEVNNAALLAGDVTREEVIGSAFWECPWWGRDDEVNERLREAIQRAGDGLAVRYDTELQVGTNKKQMIDLMLLPVRDAHSEVTHVIASAVDITARKAAEEERRKSEDRLVLAAQMAGFGTYFVDFQTGEVEWSNEFRSLVGLEVDEHLRVRPGDVPHFIHPDDRERIREKIFASADPHGDGRFVDEHRIVLPDGKTRWVLMQGRTVFDDTDDGRVPLSNAGILMDITQRREMEQQLIDARETAERANEAKSQFLANVSHEIRTPMTAILGYADILSTHLTDPDNQSCVQVIKQNGTYLCDILNDILDLSKIEAGKLTLRFEEHNVSDLLDSVRSLMEVRAREKHLDLTIVFGDPFPATVLTDARAVRQVLINLIGNAIKFTDAGSVQVRLSCRPADELAVIQIIDTGCGIGRSASKHLFQPFEQADISATRQIGGTGLGLTISRKLAQMLGGGVALVESQIGVGSTFEFTFHAGKLQGREFITAISPRVATERKDFDQEQLPRIAGRILAVDDRREVRFLVQNLVESAGGDVMTVSDGFEAIETWTQCAREGVVIDTVLMDMHMPKIDGLEATRRLRQENYRGPIIALTANTMGGDRDACLEAGCNDFISKPIDRAELIQKLHHWLHAMEQE